MIEVAVTFGVMLLRVLALALGLVLFARFLMWIEDHCGGFMPAAGFLVVLMAAALTYFTHWG